VCSWYGVLRRVGERPGPRRTRIAPIVVTSGFTSTCFRCLSLNVFSRQVKPPQRAALGASEWVPAAAAAAAPAASKIRAKTPVRFMNLAVEIVRFESRWVYSVSSPRVWRNW
jgi:hypothetical protein